MEKSQYKLCIDVLKRLDKAGVLDQFVLIGSWCTVFYKDYFADIDYQIVLKTRDLDFLIPRPRSLHSKIKFADLVKDLGFIVARKGSKGIIKLEHPELTIEFLVPEIGRGSNEPLFLPSLGVNAERLRFLNFVYDNTITIKIDKVEFRVPHPINFALHKLIIFQRRHNKEKSLKDKESALRILRDVIKKGESDLIRDKFIAVPKGWQKKIIAGLDDVTERDILETLIANN